MPLQRPIVSLVIASSLVTFGCHHHRKPTSPDGQPTAPTDATPAAAPLAAVGSVDGLTRVTADGVDESAPQLSPDGKTVIFIAFSQTTDANGNAVGQSQLLGADPSNGTARTIYTNPAAGASYPTWTPNGSLVYATNGTLVRSLTSAPNAAFTVIVDGRSTPNPTWPAVSPDGSTVAFEATVNGVESIVRAGADGSRITVLGPGIVPSWSPDGKQIVFARPSGNAGGAEIALVDAGTGANLTQVTNLGGWLTSKPKFSPDGNWIVFESNSGWNAIAGAAESTNRNLFAVKRDGTGLTQLTTGAGLTMMPFWGKDGWIYFSSSAAGSDNRDIWKMRPTGDLASASAPVATPATPATPRPATHPTPAHSVSAPR